MLNVEDVVGIKSSPISKSILENAIGSNNLRDSRSYSNYEFLLSRVTSGAFKPPSVIFASGDGRVFPNMNAHGGMFYSANILARDGYKNSWMASYKSDEDYDLSYYDGSTLFKSMSIEPSTGNLKTRSVELRNGNLPRQAGFAQLVFGFNESAIVSDFGKYRHSLRTRHSTSTNSENAIDMFVWDMNFDSTGSLGSRRVFSMYGTGSVELVSGTYVFGPVSIPIETNIERQDERSLLSQPNKGVIYFNQNENRFRYSENGDMFKYFGDGSGGSTRYYTSKFVKIEERINTSTPDGWVLDLTGHSAVVSSIHSVDEEWVDGDIKRMSISGLCTPVKLNPRESSVYTNNSIPGQVLLCIGDGSAVVYTFISTYINYYVEATIGPLISDRDKLSNIGRPYTAHFDLVREGRNVRIIHMDFKAPCYFQESTGFREGELIFSRAHGTDILGEDNSSRQLYPVDGLFGTPTNKLKYVEFTVNARWMFSSISRCTLWVSRFIATNFDSLLSIKNLNKDDVLRSDYSFKRSTNT